MSFGDGKGPTRFAKVVAHFIAIAAGKFHDKTTSAIKVQFASVQAWHEHLPCISSRGTVRINEEEDISLILSYQLLALSENYYLQIQ